MSTRRTSPCALIARVTGIDLRWRIAEYVIVPAEALAAIPNQYRRKKQRPFMCAGVTVFNALRNSGAPSRRPCRRTGDWRSRTSLYPIRSQNGDSKPLRSAGQDKEPLAKQLGAHHYIDSSTVDTVGGVAEARRRARKFWPRPPNANAISDVVGGLGVDGNLVIPAAPNDPLTVGVFPY